MKLLFLFCLLGISLSAKITLQEIKTKPPCYARDFMIWTFLDQNITKQQAKEAYSLVYRKNYKITSRYIKKSQDEKLLFASACKAKKDLFAIKDKKCLEIAITPKKTIHLTNDKRLKLINTIDNPRKKTLLCMQSEPYTQKAYEKYSADEFLNFFLSSPYSFRKIYLDIPLDGEFLQKLSSSKKFSKFIKWIVCDDNFWHLQNSLLHAKSDNLSSQDCFFLALNQLRHNNKQKAITLFKLSANKARYTRNKDKNYFWLYKVTNDMSYLQKITKLADINIYSIYAHELLGTTFDNYFFDVATFEGKSPYDITNPFVVHKILQEIKTTPKDKLFYLAQKYSYKDTKPIQALIIQKAYHYTKLGYLMPYDKHLKDINNNTKALIYAIMRQESYFIPSSLSHSYALGLMQLMPFVADIIAKNSGEIVDDYFEMFKPKKNLNYAIKHLSWLQKNLNNPLFIAYAYNGGYGFLKRYRKKHNFKNGMYEPYMSMELMANDETREYGKKVLANYIIYQKAFGKNISILQLLGLL